MPLFPKSAPPAASDLSHGRPRVFVLDIWLALAFALPAAIMAFALACNQVWPFGDRSALTIDLYHMYAPMIAHLHDILYEGFGGAWSWSIGGGMNYYTLFLTNVGSPLNAVIALFPKAALPALVGLGMVIKAGLSGLCMGWLLRFKGRGSDAWTTAFAAMYALCGWMVNYHWNIMWTDLVFLLPLVLIGVECIIAHGRWTLYLAALAAAMICNYYIAALMCVFVLLYFILAVLTRFSVLREKRWMLRRGLLFATASLLAAGLAAFCLLPVAKALTATSVVTDTFPRWELFHSYLDVAKAALPGAPANIRSGGLPHIYAGMLCVWLLPLRFGGRRAGGKSAWLGLTLLLAMAAVMNIKPLDFVWHGLHTPNDLPFRYSFCVSALLVILAYPAARRVNRKNLPWLMAWGGGLALATLATELWVSDTPNVPRMLAVPAIVLVFSALFWLRLVKGRLSAPALRLLALGLVCVELAWGATWGVMGSGNTSMRYYTGNIDRFGRTAQVIREMAGPGFYRAETASYMTLNDPALYGLYGLSHFSSMLDVGLQDLMHKLGYQTYMHGSVRANRQAGQPNTPVVDALLGVRYLLAGQREGAALANPGLREEVWAGDPAAGQPDTVVLENLWALPIAFQVDEIALDEWLYTQENPFAVQSDFVGLATGVWDVLRPVTESSLSGEGLTVSKSGENQFVYRGSELSEPGEAVLVYTVRQQSDLYFYADSDQMTDITVTVSSVSETDTDTSETSTATADGRYPKVIEIGPVSPGQQVAVRIKLGRTRMDGSFKAWMTTLDRPAFEAAFGQLAAWGLSEPTYSGTAISGFMTAADGMGMMTSIPADAGWTLYIDGRETEIIRVGDAFIGALLPSGRHQVELHWSLPGFDSGAKISLCSLMLAVLLWVVLRLEPLAPAPAPAPALGPPWVDDTPTQTPETQADTDAQPQDPAPADTLSEAPADTLSKAGPEEEEHE